MPPTLGRVFLAALALAAGGCDDAGDLGVELGVRGRPTVPNGPLERCLVITPITTPLTLDRITFEANDPSTSPATREWTDLSVSGTAELCVDVCACTGADEVAHFVVEDDGRDANVDVDWPEDYCCEGAGSPSPDAGR